MGQARPEQVVIVARDLGAAGQEAEVRSLASKDLHHRQAELEVPEIKGKDNGMEPLLKNPVGSPTGRQLRHRLRQGFTAPSLSRTKKGRPQIEGGHR
jgi:hypothetical protein